MSNPSVCFLTSAQIDGMHFGIEDNLGEAIHIHFGRLRLALSIEEFFVLAGGVMEAARQLLLVRGFELESFDVESLKGGWLENYGKIVSVQTEYVELDSLYIKESYVNNRAIKRIIPLRESGYIKVLQGDRSDIEYYEEPGRLEPSRKRKLDYIRQKIESTGYPWEQKKILADQEGYIYDGVKRASCLYYLCGGKERIPVQRIRLLREKGLEEQRKEAEREVQLWNEKHSYVKSCGSGAFLCTCETKKNAEGTDLKQFIKKLKETGIPFFLLKQQKKNQYGELIAAAVIIVQEGSLCTIREKLNWQPEKSSPYDDYEFLYTAPKPLYYLTEDGPVLIFDRLCCKNKFEKYMLPADRYVLERSWRHLNWNEEWQCCEAGMDIYVLMILMDVLFERGYFEPEDVELIEENKKIFHQKDFLRMLEKEFYGYAPVLKKYLLAQQYHKSISMYECFSDY